MVQEFGSEPRWQTVKMFQAPSCCLALARLALEQEPEGGSSLSISDSAFEITFSLRCIYQGWHCDLRGQVAVCNTSIPFGHFETSLFYLMASEKQ